MVSFQEMYDQIHKISELSGVLSHLIKERSLCDTSVTCDLFFEYVNQVKVHLDDEEKALYQPLLLHSETHVKNTANMFLSGSGEIKRVFKQYLKRWCKNKDLRIRDHDLFLKETKEIFELVSKRLVDETEKLYPVARDVMDEDKKAA